MPAAVDDRSCGRGVGAALTALAVAALEAVDQLHVSADARFEKATRPAINDAVRGVTLAASERDAFGDSARVEASLLRAFGSLDDNPASYYLFEKFA